MSKTKLDQILIDLLRDGIAIVDGSESSLHDILNPDWRKELPNEAMGNCDCNDCREEAERRANEARPEKSVPDLMADAAETFRERNAKYGDSYKNSHTVMRAIFPGGLFLESESDWQRFSLLHAIIGKLLRYTNNFNEGGHVDSVHDLGVYSFMLEEVTRMGLKENSQ